MRVWWKKYLYAALALVGLWLGGKYILPVLLPFLLGALLAVAAEPVVSFCARRLRMRRALAAGTGVTLTLVLLGGVVSVVAAVAVRELGDLAGAIPDISQGTAVLKNWLITAADKAPEGLRPLAQRTVTDLFDDSTTMMRQVTGKLPGVLTSVISGVGSSVLSVGTGILASFLISARLPVLRQQISDHLPQRWHQVYLPALKRVRTSILGWLKAQGKLCLVTWGIVTAGFLVLRIPYAPAWAALVAVVDAVPILGTGTVLVPFALVQLLQGESLQAIVLLCTYGVCAITRTALEPRLVGHQLGLDPLTTLISLYAGYRFWGFLGLLLAPIVASMVKSLFSAEEFRK